MIYRFEVHSDDWMGEKGWFPLENLQQGSDNASDIWYRSNTDHLMEAEDRSKAEVEADAKVEMEDDDVRKKRGKCKN